jgi:5'-3' exonuclease
VKRVLIVDMLNMFFRAYIVDPSLSSNGQPIGGLKGSLKILQKLIRETTPDRVVICWDGEGGSKKRKAMVKDYKAGRKPLRLNRSIRNLTENEELENKIWQQMRLLEYFNFCPISQIMIPDVEADDIIAYVKNLKYFESWQKIIVSSDKDFYQLLDDETILVRPVQKEILNKKNIVEKFGIHPNNFALARAMVGDKSDNLPGVGSIGLATVKKRFPFLLSERPYSLKEVIDFCKDSEEDLKAYKNIIENYDLLQTNYKMMQLYSPLLSPVAKKKVRNSTESPEVTFNKTEIIKMMIQDGFGEYNWSSIFQNFNRIVLDNKTF